MSEHLQSSRACANVAVQSSLVHLAMGGSSVPETTLADVLASREQDQQARFVPRETDGHFLSIPKRIFGRPIFAATWARYVRYRYSAVLDMPMSESKASNLIRDALDEHALIWMAILIAIYLVMMSLVQWYEKTSCTVCRLSVVGMMMVASVNLRTFDL